MDPNETWKALLEAYRTSDWEQAIELAEALLQWLRIDGFPPSTTIGTPSEASMVVIDDREANRQIADAVSRNILRKARMES